MTAVAICWVAFPLNCLRFTLTKSLLSFSSCCYFCRYPIITGDGQTAVKFDDPAEMKPECGMPPVPRENASSSFKRKFSLES